MARTRDEVLAAIRSGFAEGSQARVLALLDTYGAESWERERERVQLAVLALCAGDEARLGEYLAAAKRDYRDVLFWAEVPAEARIDTPEKKAAVVDLFKKLGLEPPRDLQD